MTDNTKALAQALMKTKQSPFVNQEDINYALTSRERWISADDLNIYKNLKGLTNDWENHSFKEFVKLWEYRVTNLNQTDPFENPEKILKWFNSLFKILETDKIILYSKTNAYYPEYCNVRVQAYRNALMMACHQEALMVAVTGLGIALSKKYTEHKLFIRFVQPWDYIHRVIYKTNEDKPTIPPDDVIRKLERESIVKHSISLFDLLRNSSGKSQWDITRPERKSFGDFATDIKVREVNGHLARGYSSIDILKDAESWDDVIIVIVLKSRTHSIKVNLKQWNQKHPYRRYKLGKHFYPQDFKMTKPSGEMSKGGQILEELASTGIVSFDPRCTKDTFKKRVSELNGHLKSIFGFPTDPRYWRTYNPIQYSYEGKGYIWKFGNLRFKDETQIIDPKHPETLRGAYMDLSDKDLKAEKFEEKTRVINANLKYQEDILLNEDSHRRLVLGWDEYIKPKIYKITGTTEVLDLSTNDSHIYEQEHAISKIYEHNYIYPPDEDYNEYLRLLDEEKSEKGFREKIELKEDTDTTPNYRT